MSYSPHDSQSGSENEFVFVSSAMENKSDFFATPKTNFLSATQPGRRNICRRWNSLSRFQKNLISGAMVLGLIGATYYVMAKANAKELANLGEKYRQHPKSILKIPPVMIPVATDNISGHSIPPSIAAQTSFIDHNVEEMPKVVMPKPKILRFTGPTNDRQRAVVAAFQHAWKGYKEFAWGHDNLKPMAKSHSDWFGVGLTILDGLDTMFIMNLQEEFAEAKQWVENSLSFDVDKFVNVFETTIRCLGGLLSAFHLSGEQIFLDKAKDLGDRLVGAFKTPTGLPYSDVNLHSKQAKPPAWGPESSLSEATTIQLEFRDLSRLTGDPTYENFAMNVSRHIHTDGCSKFDGLCGMYLNPKTGKFKSGYTITMGARTDSYYEYLLKQWLQTGKKIDWLKTDYLRSIGAMQKYLTRYSEPNKLTFIGELVSEKTFSPKMDHLVCFIAGTLALGAQNGLPPAHLDLARQIGHTCHQMSSSTPTGLAPEIVHFNMVPGTGKEDISIKPLDAHNLLRPEAVEAFFYLYRVTGDRSYQDWGWDVFQAMEKYSKTLHGYTSISSVKKIPVQRRDTMETFFLAETLKYLYLLFSNDTNVVSLNDFVFNTEGHPLPIYKS